MSQEIFLGKPCDMHVHLRDGVMCQLVTPTVAAGGITTAYVMPNLTPPITTVDQVQKYYKELQELSPETQFLMSMYLNASTTAESVKEAAESGIVYGYKLYPAGVTTNSSQGVDLSTPEGLESLFPVFEALQKYNMILNLHGEVPPDNEGAVNVLNAEPLFLPQLRLLHKSFPLLRIVLEHCTTKLAVDTVNAINIEDKELGKALTVAGSITAHHLWITIDDWAGCPVNFCKPVAKTAADRSALISAAISGKPWFFLGSDSAPHPTNPAKLGPLKIAAGVFTQPYILSYIAEVFEKANALDKLKGFVTDIPTKFYEITPAKGEKCVYVVKSENPVFIKDTLSDPNGKFNVIPFRAGEPCNWNIVYK